MRIQRVRRLKPKASVMNKSERNISDLMGGSVADSETSDDIELLHSISVELIGENEIGALYKDTKCRGDHC